MSVFHGLFPQQIAVEVAEGHGAGGGDSNRGVEGRKAAEAVTGSKGLWSSKKGTGYPEHSIRDFKGEVQWRYKVAEGESNDGHQMEHFPLMKAIRENKDYNEAERGALSSLTAIMGRMATYSGKEVNFQEMMDKAIRTMPEDISWDSDPPVMPDKDGNYKLPMPADFKLA